MKEVNSIWKREEKKQHNTAYNEIDAFFENLYNIKENQEVIEENAIDYSQLTYRQEQNSYALDIMEAIKQKQILLIQAGVGTGKSLGYLLPVFYTYKNVPKFKKIIISTSSIALQQQLLTDINRISNMLNINITATIAKGINNYACLKRIENKIQTGNTSIDKKIVLKQLSKRIEEIESCDKEDLKDISEEVWKEVKLHGRCFCSKCYYTTRCPFYKQQQKIDSSNIIITNHANFIRNTIDNNDLISNNDMIIFDESHQLEDTIRGIKEQTIFLKIIEKSINRIGTIIELDFSDQIISSLNDDDNIVDNYTENLKKSIRNLFSSLRKSSSIQFSNINKSNNSITDCNKLSFKYNKTIINNLNIALNNLKKFFNLINKYERENEVNINLKELSYLKQLYLVFEDMKKMGASKNIYWTEFYKNNLINLCYTNKSNLDVITKITNKDIPIIFTSATLSTSNDNYSYFMEGLELNEGINHSIVLGENYLSPFDYNNQSLFYYNPNLPTPKDNDDYIIELSLEVIELIKATKGKALVLFTSKQTMFEVYKLVTKDHFDFPIFLHTDTNTNEIKEAFANDTNSCLFATGAFWEGIDIKGASLSNLIITHLPFDVVDAVTQYKASKYSSGPEQFRKVYVPSMLLKLKQAMGRLIRSNTDTGIISCLDSRFVKYKDQIEEISQIENYTTNIQDVYDFSNQKILKKVKTP